MEIPKRPPKVELPSPWDLGIKLSPGQTARIDFEVGKSKAEQSIALRQIRGNVLASTVVIEFALDQVLARLFFENIPKAEEHIIRLNRFVLKELRMSLNSKIQLLKLVLPHATIVHDVDTKELVKNLNEIASTRNKFAHCTMYFNPGNDPNKTVLTPYLDHLGGAIKLDNAYFDGLNKIFAEAEKQLGDIERKLIGEPAKPNGSDVKEDKNEK